MIRLPDLALPARAQQQLATWQKGIDDLPSYAERVDAAKARFSAHNTAANATFRVVREHLARLSSGEKLCAYCETSVADEVEHIRPKDLYPDRVFVWLNYVYACGPCNGPKNNHFAVLGGNGQAVDVSRRHADPVEPPRPGPPALISPREEDPLAFLELDLIDTFVFLPLDGLSAADDTRARYTRDVLRLNARSELITARRRAYRNYRARLVEYCVSREAGASVAALERLRDAAMRMDHPTVWAEMKRQRALIPELGALFDAVPEALDW